ncbi:MAG TPA: lamin tail domain-containing protein, partial [Mangrovimonas sp.]|nr:lamin tail domain-containing protein [Mangrovimonas sp.]
LSSVSGTTVYLGVNYNDDGVDSYSSWSLSNIALEAYGSCPVLGTRPTSDCGLCAVTLGTETYACQSNTSGAGNDTVTVEIPYSGSDATITSVTTSTPGSVAGDDPAVTADGTITLTGLLEGDAWNITINGGNCDGTTISGTIPSNICDPVGCPNVGDIIITEIMQNPNAVNDTDGEWFEVFNTTGSPIDMQGWTISDAGTDSHTIGSSLVVPAGGYAVLGINGDLGTNGGVTVDYVYSSFTLSNSDDEVILTCSSTIIDMVAYDGGPNFPDPAGSSMQLSTTAMNSTDNDLGSNWGEGTATYGSGDIGTPGAMNDYTLSIADFNNGSLKVYPNPTDLGYVNIISANGQSVDVKVYDILGKLVKNETVSSQLDISNLTSGMYIMNIFQNGKSVTKKLIVK